MADMPAFLAMMISCGRDCSTVVAALHEIKD